MNDDDATHAHTHTVPASINYTALATVVYTVESSQDDDQNDERRSESIHVMRDLLYYVLFAT